MISRSHSLQELLMHRLSMGHAHGAVVAVTDQDHTVELATAGYSDPAKRLRFSSSSLIRLSSLTKAFVGIIAAQEFERGHLTPDTPVTDVLSWCDLRQPYGPILVRHLLTHTAGLPRGSDASVDPLFAAQQLKNIIPATPPGTRFHYSNDGWKLLGLLLEEVTGQSIERLLMERIFLPSGMSDSFARLEYEESDALVPRFCRRSPGRVLSSRYPLVQLPWGPSTSADGCAATTIEDMCRFGRVLLNGGRQLLGRQALEQLWVRDVVDPQIGWYGYGWWLYDRGGSSIVMHPGYQNGFSCVLIIDRAAGLSSFAAANGTFDVASLAESSLALCRGQSVRPPSRVIHASRILQADDYSGIYDDGQRFELIAHGTRLRFKAEGIDVLVERTDPIVRLAFSLDTLVVPSAPWDAEFLEFNRDAHGDVVGAYFGDRWFDRLPYKIPAVELRRDWLPYTGQYRSWNPTQPSLTVVDRHGDLWLLDDWGTYPLVPLDDGSFRIGTDPGCPERLSFSAITPHGATRVSAADGEGSWYRVSERTTK